VTTQALVDGIADDLKEYEVVESDNLCPNEGVSTVTQGVTFIVNSDKSVTVSTGAGGATGNAFFLVATGLTLKAGTYKLVGCPNGGSDQFFLYCNSDFDGTAKYDYGTGKEFTLSVDGTGGIRIFIGTGTVITTPITFKPMITKDLTATYDDYKPYYTPLKDAMWTKEQQKKNGAYNLLPNNGTTQVINGITFTYNSDGTITVQGNLAPGKTYAVSTFYNDATHNLPSGTYKLCGCPLPNDESDFCIDAWDTNSEKKDFGHGQDFTITAGTRFYVAISVYADIPNAITFKPMVTTDMNATYADYVPYAKTNRELTENRIKYGEVSGTLSNTQYDGYYWADVAIDMPTDAVLISALPIVAGSNKFISVQRLTATTLRVYGNVSENTFTIRYAYI